MCRDEIPRIREIIAAVEKCGCSGHYFENFDNSLLENPTKREHFLHLETELAELDCAAWSQLKEQVVPFFKKKYPVRGWQSAFDKLNQAKAYKYLAMLGCREVSFIPESSIPGKKTPDLEGRLGSTSILCEVKTINPSDEETNARGRMIARPIQGDLPEAFFNKLSSTVVKANTQMDSYCQDRASRRFVYVILNFDDNLHEYVDHYMQQVQDFCRQNELPRIELIFDMKPAFYSATTKSATSSWFIWSEERIWKGPATLPH